MAGKRQPSAGPDQTAKLVSAMMCNLIVIMTPLGEIKTGVRTIYEVTDGCQQGLRVHYSRDTFEAHQQP
jgi:hypothetical protein